MLKLSMVSVALVAAVVSNMFSLRAVRVSESYHDQCSSWRTPSLVHRSVLE